MKLLIIIVSFLIIIWSGCENSTSVNPGPSQSEIQEILKRVKIEQIDYFTIHFQNSDSLFINPSEIDRIIFGFFKDELFSGVDTLTEIHTTGNSSLLTFSDSITVSDSLSDITMGIKYILKNHNPFIVKKDFFLFSYPYQTTKIILNYSVFLSVGWIQDFAYSYPILYYHPTGPEGIFRVNLETYDVTNIVSYAGGDFMDGNNDYLFFDDGHYSIKRYDLNTDSVDAQKDLVDGYYISISGTAVSDSLVYVIATDGKLYILDLNLNLLNVREFTGDYCQSLTYYHGFLYSLTFHPGGWGIIKINAVTGQIIDENKSPTLYTSTIKISKEGVVYFMEDLQKKFCYTWLDDIFPPED